MKRGVLKAVVVSLLIAAGCGSEQAAVHSTSAREVRLTVPSTDAEELRAETCATDLKTMQVAWEAYYATTGMEPASEADLVLAGLLRRESTGFDLVGGEFVAVPGICE